MKAAICKHSSNFNYFHSCRDESVRTVKIKCRYKEAEDRMVTLHCWFFFPFRIKLCSCKISGCCFSFVLTPHSWQHWIPPKLPSLLPSCSSLAPPCLTALSCTAGTSWWCRACQTWQQGACLLPSVSVPDTNFPSGTHNFVQTLHIQSKQRETDTHIVRQTCSEHSWKSRKKSSLVLIKDETHFPLWA